MRRQNIRSILPLAACAALACGQAKKSTSVTPPAAGQSLVRVSTLATPHSPADLTVYGGLICMTLDLTPFAYDANGNPVSTGQRTVTIHSTPTPTDTDAVLSCSTGGPTVSNPAGGTFNWGYTVTARQFGDCTTYTAPSGTVTLVPPNTTADAPNGAPIPQLAGMSPVTIQAPFNCQEDSDEALNIDVPLEMAQSNGTGYVDVNVTTDPTEVMVGCKTADINPNDGLLHFGSTSLYSASNAAPLGLTAIGYIDATSNSLDPLAAGFEPAQFAGMLNGAPDNTAYITATMAPDGGPAGSTGSWDIVQAFVPRPTDPTQWCAGTLVPECDTTYSVNQAEPTTATMLASAVITLPSGLWMVANVTPTGDGLQITSGGDVNPALYSDPTALPAATTGWNAETSYTTLQFPDASTGDNEPIENVSIDPTSPGQLIVTTLVADSTVSTQAYYLVSYDGAEWTSAATAYSALAAGQQTALLAPLPAGCQSPPTARFTATIDLTSVASAAADALQTDSSNVCLDLISKVRTTNTPGGGAWSDKEVSEQIVQGQSLQVSGKETYGIYALSLELANAYPCDDAQQSASTLTGYPQKIALSAFSLNTPDGLPSLQLAAATLFVDPTGTIAYGGAAAGNTMTRQRDADLQLSISAPVCSSPAPFPSSQGDAAGFTFGVSAPGLSDVLSLNGQRTITPAADLLQSDQIFTQGGGYQGVVERRAGSTVNTRVDLSGNFPGGQLLAAQFTTTASSTPDVCDSADIVSAGLVQPLANANPLLSSAGSRYWVGANLNAGEMVLTAIDTSLAAQELSPGDGARAASFVAGTPMVQTISPSTLPRGTSIEQACFWNPTSDPSSSTPPTLEFSYSVASDEDGVPATLHAGEAVFNGLSWAVTSRVPYGNYLECATDPTGGEIVGQPRCRPDCAMNIIEGHVRCWCSNSQGWFTLTK